MITVIAENQTASPIPLANLGAPNGEIPASGSVTLSDFNAFSEIQDDEQLASLVDSDDVLLNIGGGTLSKADSAALLTPVTPDDIPTGGGPDDRIEVYDSAGGQNFTTSAIVVDFDVERVNTVPASFTLNAGGSVTVNFSGVVIASFITSFGGGNNRATTRTALFLNGAEVPGTRSWGYHRNNASNEDTGGGFAEFAVASGDVIDVRAVRESGGVTMFTLANGSRLRIERLS